MHPRIRLIVGSLATVALALAWALPASAQIVIQPHAPAANHAKIPARLETVIELDMGEWTFGAPAFRVPAGKTIGLHLHNEGVILHELAIGRGPELVNGSVDGYETNLFTEVKSDLFFYWGDSRVELEGVRFDELEVDPSIRDVWIRFTIPEEFAGEWEIGCFVAGHYDAGMHATLIVE